MHSLFLPLRLFCTATWNKYKLMTVLDLEYFVVSSQWPFFFWLPSKDDIHGRNHTYYTKTNMCYFLWESINRCYQIYYWLLLYDKRNNREKSFCQASYHFADINHHFSGKNWEKSILHWHFFVSATYHFGDANWEKPILHRHCKGKKSELQGLHLLWKMSTILSLQRQIDLTNHK